MKTITLDGIWRMKRTTDHDWIEATVPGSVLHDLLQVGGIEDPFYRDNADRVKQLLRDDYEYERTFCVDETLLAEEQVLLRFEGLNTLAEVEVNGRLVLSAENMHRTHEVNVKQALTVGDNRIRVVFRSGLVYAEQRAKDNPIWHASVGMAPGFNQIRQAHSMFGWDWGPILPDMGIWRSVSLRGYSVSRLSDVYVTQHHAANLVTLDVRVTRECGESRQAVEALIAITGPNGYASEERVAIGEREQSASVQLTVENPALWWPNGYGDQPLYDVRTTLLAADGQELDSNAIVIGLRTIEWRREPDQWGESFEAVVNGVSIFAMGANYIPEDSLLPRCTPERTERLIRDCSDANFNMLRVWGGAYFQEDYFYDLCDRYGILVWQDLLFACAAYEMTDDFTASIVAETIDNVKRLRHHASLAIWCGNNEMEWAWVEWNLPQSARLRTDYIKQFEVVLPQVVREHDPNTFYWLASPSSGGGFDNPNDPVRGDVHYWSVWHGGKPFTDYRKYNFRFCSEFGFQSMPSTKTIETFTEPEDRNLLSYIMEKHQNHPEANGRILNYLAQVVKFPKDFAALVYATQIVQAEAIRYGVEYWRQNRGISMGSIYWQLNDCWPVTSWSSIDYYGRWKALHYAAKQFYAPVLASAREEDGQVGLYVTNDTREPVEGTFVWALKDIRSQVIREGSVSLVAEPLSARLAESLDFTADLAAPEARRTSVVEFAFLGTDGTPLSRGTTLFVRPKHVELLDPRIESDVTEHPDHYAITLTAQAYAMYVELDLDGADGVFDRNYVDLSAATPETFVLQKSRLSTPLTLDDVKQRLRVRSMFDIA